MESACAFPFSAFTDLSGGERKMNTVIMWLMAFGAVLGGLDRILGNRFGLGKRFEEGFELLGATALSG